MNQQLHSTLLDHRTIPAIRLFNLENGDCSFERGYIREKQNIPITYFFAQTQVDELEKVLHPAPRRQYVITLKGKLRFQMSDGSSFIIEPGIVLLAEDIDGPGHSWELIEGTTWERLYLVTDPDRHNVFTAHN